jgi:hypothetical protein
VRGRGGGGERKKLIDNQEVTQGRERKKALRTMKPARYYLSPCTGWSICIVCAPAVLAELLSLESGSKGNAVSEPESEEERGRKTKGKRKGGGEEEPRKDEENESKPSTALDVLDDQKK